MTLFLRYCRCVHDVGARGASAQTSFKGETISINIGYPAGGAPDLYFRVLARHYGRHIPGNPAVVPKNMPGAGTLRAANYLYNVAAKDGTELANFSSSATMEPLMDNDQARFDADQVQLGRQHESGDQLLRHLAAAGSSDVVCGDVEAGNRVCVLGRAHVVRLSASLIFKNVLGAKVRMVSGYPGMAQAYVALSGAKPTACAALSARISRRCGRRRCRKAGSSSSFRWDRRRPTSSAHVANIFDFAKTDDDRKVLEFHFHTKLLGRPLAGPPGVPKERLAILRKAFQDTMRDREFLADAEKANLDIDPATHEQVEQLLAQFADYPKAVIDRAKAAITR